MLCETGCQEAAPRSAPRFPYRPGHTQKRGLVTALFRHGDEFALLDRPVAHGVNGSAHGVQEIYRVTKLTGPFRFSSLRRIRVSNRGARTTSSTIASS